MPYTRQTSKEHGGDTGYMQVMRGDLEFSQGEPSITIHGVTTAHATPRGKPVVMLHIINVPDQVSCHLIMQPDLARKLADDLRDCATHAEE